MSRLMSVVAVSALLSGCSGASSAPWEPPSAPEAQMVTAFGRPVPSGEHIKLQAAEQLRSVDPCGVLNLDSLSRLGEVMTAGPSRALSECVVNVAVAGQSLPGTVKVDLAANGPSPDDETLDIAGETVAFDTLLSTGYSCHYQVPVKFPATPAPMSGTETEGPDIVELPPVPYMSVSASNFRSVDGGQCAVAQEVVAGILTTFAEDRVPRRNRAPVGVPLAERSPCELMERFPSEFPVERFDATTAPYECKLWVGGEIVGVYFKAEDGDSAMRPVSGQRAETIAGYPVLASEDDWPGGPKCVFNFAVGPVYDGSRPGSAGPGWVRDDARVQPTAQVNGPCEPVRAVMPAALELFGANR
ncbi:hypothetical protein ACFWPH_28400 [Nocardia sp. NPDC058499]|uniref:hypothetical protein n=1 Tax=Nocardia sp. NPDC058499 TaxID=3346530 RepID=UPI00365A6D28